MTQRIIQPLKQSNRLHPDITKDEIVELCNQDDVYTWAKGYALTSFEDKEDILCPRISRVEFIN